MNSEKSPLFIEQIEIGPMKNFTYVVGSETTREVALVDPAWDIDGLVEHVEEQDFKLVAALVTHYHPDHCGGGMRGHHIEGVAELLGKRGVKVYVHREEADGLRKVTGLEESDLVRVDSGDRMSVGEIEVEFLHTPGHTPGSQCFRIRNTLVSGDTLFIQGCGRVDLPGSDPDSMYESLKRLASLPDETPPPAGTQLLGRAARDHGRDEEGELLPPGSRPRDLAPLHGRLPHRLSSDRRTRPMPAPIVVINPNSTRAVTDGMSEAVESLRRPGGPAIECVTMEGGPPGVETQMDAESVVLPICDYVHGRNDDAGAFVIGCYSDPGLHAAREVARVPVFGIAESAMATALTRGDRFGVISILPGSVPRHLRQVRAMGLESRLAGDLPVGLGVTELGGEDEVYERMEETGRRLRDECGADVVILGCTGMAHFRRPLEAALGLPVVEPTRAAVALALGVVTA